jgi:hypothetical protein
MRFFLGVRDFIAFLVVVCVLLVGVASVMGVQVAESTAEEPRPFIKLSYVLAGRNDAFMSGERAGRCISVLYLQLMKYASVETAAEIVIVEWWPQAGQASIMEAMLKPLDLPPSPWVTVRVITVPNDGMEQNKKVNPHGLPFLEYEAKNVGVRRAKAHTQTSIMLKSKTHTHTNVHAHMEHNHPYSHTPFNRGLGSIR